MNQQQLEQLRGVCAEAGFARKGNAFFRIVGDGVLQIVRPRYERAFRAYVIFVGLLSMYDRLTPRHFTAAGCVARYPVTNCAACNGIPLIFAPDLAAQTELLRAKVIPGLDTLDTQKKLVHAISQLDPRWNDAQKIGPFIACGQINHARKVIKEIIGQHAYAQASGLTRQIMPDADRETQIYNLLVLLNRDDPAEIDGYLQENYAQNLILAKFCICHRE